MWEFNKSSKRILDRSDIKIELPTLISASSNNTCPKSISSLQEILVSFLKMKLITLTEDLKKYIIEGYNYFQYFV